MRWAVCPVKGSEGSAFWIRIRAWACLPVERIALVWQGGGLGVVVYPLDLDEMRQRPAWCTEEEIVEQLEEVLQIETLFPQ